MFMFKTDKDSEEYCREIAEEMVKQFGISMDEAIIRINENWKRPVTGHDHVIYHESPEYWAKDICYGHDSYWWQDESNAKIRPLNV